MTPPRGKWAELEGLLDIPDLRCQKECEWPCITCLQKMSLLWTARQSLHSKKKMRYRPAQKNHLDHRRTNGTLSKSGANTRSDHVDHAVFVSTWPQGLWRPSADGARGSRHVTKDCGPCEKDEYSSGIAPVSGRFQINHLHAES